MMQFGSVPASLRGANQTVSDRVPANPSVRGRQVQSSGYWTASPLVTST
jgi:hypothetical protein